MSSSQALCFISFHAFLPATVALVLFVGLPLLQLHGVFVQASCVIVRKFSSLTLGSGSGGTGIKTKAKTVYLHNQCLRSPR